MAIRKLRFARRDHHLVYNLSLTFTAFVLGLVSVVILFEIVIFRDFTLLFSGGRSTDASTGTVTQDQLHGAAPEAGGTVIPSNAAATGDVTVTVRPSSGYSYVGQKDVSFLSLELKASKPGRVENLTVTLDGLARPSDVKSVQLYFDGKFMEDVPFFEGKGKFENLKLQLDTNSPSKLEIKGWVSDEAFSGDRVKLGLVNGSDLVIRDSGLQPLVIQGELPLWGGAVSVIGNHVGL